MGYEIWKDIPGYEGYYQVSNKGNVRSMDREFIDSIGRKCFLRGVPIKPKLSKGYLRVGLKKHQETKRASIHRLVASAFIDNPKGYGVVNHINGIKTDNRVENLEWCTVKHNVQHAFMNNLGGYSDKSIAKLLIINEKTAYKRVEVTYPNGSLKIFNSVKEVSDYFGIKITTINAAILKDPHRVFGYTFLGYKE